MLQNIGTLGSYFKTIQTDVGLLNGSITQIAKQDGSRYAVILSNNSSAAAVVQFGSGSISFTGVRVINTANPVKLLFDEIGGAVQEALFATCDVPSTVLNVLEVFWLPPAGVGGETP